MKKKKEWEEEYVFYRLAEDDLREAYRSLDAIKRYKRNIAISALVKTAIVSLSNMTAGEHLRAKNHPRCRIDQEQ